MLIIQCKYNLHSKHLISKQETWTLKSEGENKNVDG